MEKTLLYICLFISSFNIALANEPDSSFFYMNQANTAISNYKFEKALIFTYNSVNYKNKIGKSNLGIEFLILGKTYNNLDKLDSSIYYLNQAEISLKKIKFKNEYALTKLEIGRVSKKTSNYIRALSSLSEALLLFESLNDSVNIGTVKLNIGNVYKNVGKYNKSLINYKEAIGIYTALNLRDKIGDCYNNIGNLYYREQNVDSAFIYFKKCLNIRKNTGDKINSTRVYQNLSNIFVIKNQLDSALFYIDKSLKIKHEIENKDLVGEYYTLGDIYFKKQDFNNAFYYYNEALLLSQKQNNIEVQKRLNLELGKTCIKMLKYKKSAEYFNNASLMTDSILKMNPEIEVEAKFTNYELIKDSLKNKQLILKRNVVAAELSNLELNAKLSKSKINYIISLLAVVVILGGLLYYSFRKRLKQSQNHQEILSAQNDELKRTLISKEEKEVLLKEVHHRVKNNLQIINSLVRLQSNYMTPNNYHQKLIETENRIRSMALVHEKLYQSNELSKLSAKSYIQDLTENIKNTFDSNIQIEIKYDIDNIECNIDSLIPMGLIINETVSNAIKYAFESRENGLINLSLKFSSDQKIIILTIKDNGIGADLDYEELSEDSLGMELIASLCDQLNGTLKLNTDNGFEYKFIFPDLK